MELLEREIEKSGKVLPGNILKVGSFLNQQMDAEFITKLAEEIYNELKKNGIETIIDDRNERAGVKFKDADLIGIPVRINVGKKANESVVEFKIRKTGEMFELTKDEAIKKVIEMVK